MKNKKTTSIVTMALVLTIMVLTPLIASGQSESSERSEGRGEHSSEVESGSRAGEESGNRLSLVETYDCVRNGSRLILTYNKAKNIFTGTVENISNSELKNVRIEIHLSNGIELGPTKPVNLAVGQKINVTMAASAKTFTGWTPHAEVGTGESGEDSEGNESHGSESGEGSEGGEHN